MKCTPIRRVAGRWRTACSNRSPRGQERLKEAAKLGFTRAMIPEANKPKQAIPGMEIVAVRRVEEAFQKLRELE